MAATEWVKNFTGSRLFVTVKKTGPKCLRRITIGATFKSLDGFQWNVTLSGPIKRVERVAKTQKAAQRAVETVIRVMGRCL